MGTQYRTRHDSDGENNKKNVRQKVIINDAAENQQGHTHTRTRTRI